MKSLALRALVVLLPITLTLGDGTTTFYVKKGAGTCSGDFLQQGLGTSCDEGCTFGSTVNLGAIFFSDVIYDDGVEVDIEICLISADSKDCSKSTVVLCDIGNPVDDDGIQDGDGGQNCTANDFYVYNGSVELPADDGDDEFSNGGYGISVTETIQNDDMPSFTCTVWLQAKEEKQGHFRMAAIITSVGLVAVGCVAFFLVKRSRNAATSSKEGVEQPETDFAAMADPIQHETL